MNKKEIQKRVLQNGRQLSLDKFNWDKKTKTFSSIETNLVLDFKDVNFINFITGSDCTFKTGYYCTFKTGSGCTFNTYSNCTFDTGSSCTFDTHSNCTFKTGYYCTFKTGSGCTFKTGFYCTFKTGYYCTFKTGSDCTFDTYSSCTFKTGHNCTFKTGSDCTFKTGYYCVIVRRDIFEVIQLEKNIKIKLNKYKIKGFKIMKNTKTITIDGKDIEISNESFENLKKQLK